MHGIVKISETSKVWHCIIELRGFWNINILARFARSSRSLRPNMADQDAKPAEGAKTCGDAANIYSTLVEGMAQKKKGTLQCPLSLWVDGFNSFVSKWYWVVKWVSKCFFCFIKLMSKLIFTHNDSINGQKLAANLWDINKECQLLSIH